MILVLKFIHLFTLVCLFAAFTFFSIEDLKRSWLYFLKKSDPLVQDLIDPMKELFFFSFFLYFLGLFAFMLVQTIFEISSI